MYNRALFYICIFPYRKLSKKYLHCGEPVIFIQVLFPNFGKSSIRSIRKKAMMILNLLYNANSIDCGNVTVFFIHNTCSFVPQYYESFGRFQHHAMFCLL